GSANPGPLPTSGAFRGAGARRGTTPMPPADISSMMQGLEGLSGPWGTKGPTTAAGEGRADEI
ncbi:MAG: hypothetical protein KDE35_04235, partial [Geminicoccaceae bacterium]|nr:hypothetical protein [Geminicoccaceae bacterium]